MIKKRKNTTDIYELKEAYEIYYNDLVSRTNNLRMLYTNTINEYQEKEKEKHNIELEVKYAHFAEPQNIEKWEKKFKDIIYLLKEIEIKKQELEEALEFANKKVEKTKMYLEKVKINIAISETMQKSAETDDLTDCFVYLREETLKEKERNFAKAKINNWADKYE